MHKVERAILNLLSLCTTVTIQLSFGVNPSTFFIEELAETIRQGEDGFWIGL